VNDQRILELRRPKAAVDQSHAYGAVWEDETDAAGRPAATVVVLLTNRECPFRCVMCDLWTHTLDVTVERGAIPAQIRRALAPFPPARQVKLYNSGSFFDPRAIPPEDDDEVAAAVNGFDRVIVESHPAFLTGRHGERCVRFKKRLRRAGPDVWTRLEVAIGLETAHEPTLARLNKRVTLDDFRRAADFLHEHDIDLRVFVLLNPPWLPAAAAVDWACRSIDVAEACGAVACSVIPTRRGNGAMGALGDAAPPSRLRDLEAVVEYGLSSRRRRVFADLWDDEQFFECACSPARAARLRAMNRLQRVTARVECECDG
jgi:radical SAM enzyme (TIGR01210 family)